MAFTEEQKNLLRDGLRTYYRYELGIAGKEMSWPTVQTDIEVYTGVDVPHERMRQFVEAGAGMKQERLNAILQFLTR